MEFEYTSHFYVSENDLNEMAELVKNGYNVEDAILKVAACWDDEVYYSIDLVIDKLVEEILRRALK